MTGRWDWIAVRSELIHVLNFVPKTNVKSFVRFEPDRPLFNEEICLLNILQGANR